MVQHMSDTASILSSTPTLIQSDDPRFVELHSVREPRRHDGFMRLQESEDAPSKRLRELMFGPTLRPWFTWASAATMIIIMIFEYAKSLDLARSMIQTAPFNPLIGPSSTVFIITGARYTPCMRSVPSCTNITSCIEFCQNTNEGFRFFSALFIHAGLIHIVLALVIHIWIGAGLERSLGVVRFAILYLVPGTFGFVLSALVSPATAVSTGCTGALLGLAGFMLVDMAFHPDTVQKKRLACVLLSIPVAFLFGIFPYIDNFCHLGGLVMGMIMGCALVPQRRTSSCIKWCIRVIAASIALAVFVSCLYVFYSVSDPTTMCPNCKYFSCVPYSNWCEQ